jgi:hypothetical protein
VPRQLSEDGAARGERGFRSRDKRCGDLSAQGRVVELQRLELRADVEGH